MNKNLLLSLLLFVVVVFQGTQTMAQTRAKVAPVKSKKTSSSSGDFQKMQVGPAFDLFIPIGDWSDLVSLGVGASGQFQYQITDKLAATANVGYTQFLLKEKVDGFSISAIPLLGGVKYYIKNGLYAQGNIGLYMLRSKISFLGQSETDSDSKFAFGVGAGYELNLGKMNLDLNGRYQIVEDANHIAIRAALLFPIGN